MQARTTHLKRASALAPRRERATELARDAEVVLAARAPAAFNLALRRFSNLIRKTTMVFLRSATDVEDLQQEVSLALFQQLHQLRNPESIRPYIITLTSRLAQQHLRKLRSSYRVFGSAEVDVERAAAPVDVEAAHALNRVRALLLRLREREREPFLLHLGAGMSMLEVAQATGMSVATARRKFNRAARNFSRIARRDLFVAPYLSKDH